ncbi:MAG: HAMP domain-containing histidine kinase [Spirochaetia bacterium]|nr:HAMP domain-containing histidine kinase [Spirochaetia bacterium]
MKAPARLSRRINLVAAGIFLPLFLLVAGALALGARQGLKDELDDFTRVLGKRLNVTLGAALRSGDAGAAAAMLSVEMEDERLVRAAAYAADGRMLAGFVRTSMGKVLPMTAGELYPGERPSDHRVTVEIESDGVLLGRVDAGLDFQVVRVTVVRTLLRILLLLLAASFVAVIALVIYARRSLVRDIRNLGAVVSRLGGMDLGARTGLVARRTDELGELARGLDRMADMLADYSSSLEKLITERNARLVESERLALLGSMSAGVAHEVNTPLGVGVTAASHLQERVKDLRRALDSGSLEPDELGAFLSDVEDAGSILLSNIRKALDFLASFKRLAVDQGAGRVRLVRLRDYVSDVVLSLRPRLKRTRHRIDVDIPEDLHWNCDPGQLSQILTNLIVNSLNHAYREDQGGVMRIEAGMDGEWLRLRYSDDGAGIGSSVLPRIFEPFFTTKAESGGSGLGLYILHSIVSGLGGTVSCESQEGKGTRFTISLPRMPAESDGEGAA